jgi:hypothetical protein
MKWNPAENPASVLFSMSPRRDDLLRFRFRAGVLERRVSGCLVGFQLLVEDEHDDQARDRHRRGREHLLCDEDRLINVYTSASKVGLIDYSFCNEHPKCGNQKYHYKNVSTQSEFEFVKQMNSSQSKLKRHTLRSQRFLAALRHGWGMKKPKNFFK